MSSSRTARLSQPPYLGPDLVTRHDGMAGSRSHSHRHPTGNPVQPTVSDPLRDVGTGAAEPNSASPVRVPMRGTPASCVGAPCGGQQLVGATAMRSGRVYSQPGKPRIDWDDEVARSQLIDSLVRDALAVLEAVAVAQVADSLVLESRAVEQSGCSASSPRRTSSW